MHPELVKNSSNQYMIEPNIERLSDHETITFCDREACGLFLDKDGNILYGEWDRMGGYAGSLGTNVESFGVEDVDVAYFCNPYI